jgi:hypothetical protein
LRCLAGLHGLIDLTHASTRPKPSATGLAPLVRSWPLLYRIWIRI